MKSEHSRLAQGDAAPEFDVTDLEGRRRRLSDYRGRKVLVSFYRYAACPLCNLRVHELSKHREAFQRRGLDVLAFFHSPEKSMKKHLERHPMPFPIVADPHGAVAGAYGVESSLAAVAVAFVHPRALTALVKGFMPGKPEGNKLLVPADFLIDEGQRVAEAFYAPNIVQHIPIERIYQFIGLSMNGEALGPSA